MMHHIIPIPFARGFPDPATCRNGPAGSCNAPPRPLALSSPPVHIVRIEPRRCVPFPFDPSPDDHNRCPPADISLAVGLEVEREGEEEGEEEEG